MELRLNKISVIFSNFLVLIGFVVHFVSSLTNFYPTTLTELEYLYDICIENRVGGINLTINNFNGCLNRTLTNPRSMASLSDKDERILECRDPRNYRGCFHPVAQKINECVPGRGDTVEEIQQALYNQFCMNGGNVLKILDRSTGNRCVPNYKVSACTSQDQWDAWNSLDECKSLQAFRLCQETAFSSCSNDVLTKLLLKSIQKAEKTLPCFSRVSQLDFLIQFVLHFMPLGCKLN